jgi:cytochrome P450
LLSTLLRANAAAEEPITDDELVDDIFTMLFAGEGTASALAWFFFHVLQRKESVDRIRSELDGCKSEAGMDKFPYLQAALRESLRLTPTFPSALRVAKAPVKVGGYLLPPGVGVSAAIYLTHRRADLWDEPQSFKPERFLQERPSPTVYFPFGGGDRRCLGAALAMHEMTIIASAIISRCDLRIANGYQLRPQLRTVIVVPSRGVPVVLERRR